MHLTENEDPSVGINAPPFLNAAWKQVNGGNRTKTVLLKERAVLNGLAGLESFLSTMMPHLHLDVSVEGRMNMIR